MRYALALAVALVAALAARGARAEIPPVRLALETGPESVYAPVEPAREEEGINAGGVNLDLRVSYLTDYVFRGMERFDASVPEDRANLQLDAKIAFDLGKLPHPFIEVFVNVQDSDPISSFQEIRPVLGFDWRLRPLVVSAGHSSYIFPDRDALGTTEIWGQVALDDSVFFKTMRPIFSPYVYAAYDYHRYEGWYFEGGVRHDLRALEDVGILLRLEAAASYVSGFELFSAVPGRDSGFQHYRLGLKAMFSLNSLFRGPAPHGAERRSVGRYGEWLVVGYLYYTDGIDKDLRADTQLWGGAGIEFRY